MRILIVIGIVISFRCCNGCRRNLWFPVRRRSCIGIWMTWIARYIRDWQAKQNAKKAGRRKR